MNLRLNGRRWLAIVALLCLRVANAQWTPAQLDTLANAFAAGMAPGYSVDARPWYFMTGCGLTDCEGNNPDTVYGFPNFGSDPGQPVLTRSFAPSAALVFVMETPPPMRYFGVTAYMGNRYYARLPGHPLSAGTVAVNESLTDTTNLATIGTAGDPRPGVQPFGQLAVFVTTADATTLADVRAQFATLGFPAGAVNVLPLPVSVQPPVPLVLGTDSKSDTYSSLLRLTYPLDPAQQADYLRRAPVRSFYLSARANRTLTPVPPTVYRTPGNGVSEPLALRRAQGQLVSQLLAQYAAQYPAISESRPLVVQTFNYDNIARGVPGSYDNPDALYVVDAGGTSGVALGADDRILVVGVNHGSTADGTGKSTYFSHALQVVDGQRGVLAVADTWLARTGLVAGGVSDPGDPRYDTYRRLYAFSLGYRCPAGDPLCITIPQGAGGVPVGAPLMVVGRIYLDPATLTRPAKDELVLERAFVMRSSAAAAP